MDNYIKFGAIVLCLFNSFITAERCRDGILLRLAMLFTVLADFQMLITKNNLLGIFFFCIVQQIYCYRYAGLNYCKMVLKALCATALALYILKTEALIFMAAIYACTFAASLYAVFHIIYPWPNIIFTRLGMVLFALCDINVALTNISLPLLSEHRGLMTMLIWIFYMPAQVLLSFSGKRYATT